MPIFRRQLRQQKKLPEHAFAEVQKEALFRLRLEEAAERTAESLFARQKPDLSELSDLRRKRDIGFEETSEDIFADYGRFSVEKDPRVLRNHFERISSAAELAAMHALRKTGFELEQYEKREAVLHALYGFLEELERQKLLVSGRFERRKINELQKVFEEELAEVMGKEKLQEFLKHFFNAYSRIRGKVVFSEM